MDTKLYRSRADRVVAGVAGGLGRYLNLDPILVRLFFVLLTISGGIGVLLYLVLAIVIPEVPESGAEIIEDTPRAITAADRQRTRGLIGGSLVLMGMFFLMQTFNVPVFSWIRFDDMWPLLLIVAGGALLWQQYREQHQGS